MFFLLKRQLGTNGSEAEERRTAGIQERKMSCKLTNCGSAPRSSPCSAELFGVFLMIAGGDCYVYIFYIIIYSFRRPIIASIVNFSLHAFRPRRREKAVVGKLTKFVKHARATQGNTHRLIWLRWWQGVLNKSIGRHTVFGRCCVLSCACIHRAAEQATVIGPSI